MGNMVYVFSGVARMYANHFGIGCRLQLLRPRRSDETLGGGKKAREVYEIAQCRYLCDGLDGAFSEDSEETCGDD
jgi:hypothetical protein